MAMGSNRQLIGKPYNTVRGVISRASGKAYAAATDDLNPNYDAPRFLMPPLAVVTATLPHGVAQVACDEALIGDPTRLLRILHLEEEIEWLRPVHFDVPFFVTPILKSIDAYSAGELLRIETVLADGDGEILVRTHTALLFREKNPAAPPLWPVAVAISKPAWETALPIALDQSERYAAASGDHNPIHLDDKVAQLSGLKGRILHGLCTLAMAQRSIVQHAAAGDPARLKRLRVRFSKPVYPGESLRCAGQRVDTPADPPAPRATVHFEVCNGHADKVLSGGVAMFA